MSGKLLFLFMLIEQIFIQVYIIVHSSQAEIYFFHLRVMNINQILPSLQVAGNKNLSIM